MAKFSIVYIALCELTFGVMAGWLAYTIDSGNSRRDLVPETALCALALIAISVFFGMVCLKSWGWYGSWIVGLIVVAMSCWIIRAAMRPDPYGDSGASAIFGIAFLLFALPAFVLLLLPSTRRRLHVGNV